MMCSNEIVVLEQIQPPVQAAHLLVLAKAKWFEAQKREGKDILDMEAKSNNVV